MIDLFLEEESQHLAMLGGLHRQADLAAGGIVGGQPGSSTTSS
ncbi:hypothetical protein ACU4GD_41250 [Cupriavidus basilensis]